MWRMKRYLLPLFIILTTLSFNAVAQQFVLSGRITDKNSKPIGFVSVYIRNSTYGTTSNENGVYRFKLEPGNYDVVYRFVGYKERIEKVTITDHDERRNLQMENEVYQLRPVTINNKKIRDTAAISIMRKVIAKRQYYLNEVDNFSSTVYIKGVQRLTDAPKSLLKDGVNRVLDLDSNGRGIIYQSESVSNFSFQQPNQIKEVTVASKMEGITPTFSYNKASDLLANFYNNVFYVEGLSSRGFTSPISSHALSVYNYQLIGSTLENGRTIHKIQITPKRYHDQAFRGFIYIIDGDWRLYSVNLTLNSDANALNLVDTMRISQQYVPVKDNVWMPGSIQYDYKGNVLGFKFDGYYLGIYNNYKFDIATPPGYFNGEILRIDTAANTKTADYWAAIRPVPLTTQEALDFRKKDSLATVQKTDAYIDSLHKANNSFSPLPYLIFGYTATSRNNKDSLYVFPFIQTLYYNTVEGLGINLKARYTKVFNDFRTYSITPALRYALGNKLFSANIATSYTYDPSHSGNFFFNIGSDILDLNNVGTRSLYFNTLSTLLYENNYVKYYRSQFGTFGYQRELSNGILWTASLSYGTRTQLYNTSYYKIFDNKNQEFTSNNPLAPLAPADDRSFLFPKHQALTFSTSVKFTFNQQYITRPTGKIFLPSKYPTLTINYRKGINKVFGSDVNYDFASADISQYNIRIGLSGYSSFKLTGGGFMNTKSLYFMDFNHFLGNQGTTFDPTYIGSFHFLPFYTYSTSSAFLEAHYQHNFSGSILRRIPWVRKLKIEEIVGANYLTTRGNNNYSEFYVGIQRLIFRIDYGVSFMGDKKYLQGIRIFYGIR
ncbi:DUF5686 and carboxypeptidase regulatory-like domain-containing protein [Mucilaginibacter puniceus]